MRMKALPTDLSTRSKSLPKRSISCVRAALDVPLAKLFDYTIPAGMEARVGDRVVVPFGARQRLGVVIEGGVTSELPAARVKPIVALRDDAPRLPADWLELMRFLSGYYQRPLGETVIRALPPRLRSVKPLPRKALQSASAPWSARFVPNHLLNAAQARALDRMASALGSFGAFLLHGVTGSGKTEVYLNLIARVLARGGQALVLVPEISLTPQLEAVFRQAFSETRLALLHSGLEDVARTGSWLDAARGDAGIVLGTRLAVLASLPKLALVVVDEEHDTSFKQQEGLRYSARDVAVYRAKLADCPAILGTATPSLETWHNWQSGRYERLELPERAVPGARLPAVRTIDLRHASLQQGLAAPLLAAIEARLKNSEQSLVFINRRGYAPVLACEACGWTAGCARCTARMVVHAVGRVLRCHHCGAESAIPRACPTCGNVDLKPMGRGTQRGGVGVQPPSPGPPLSPAPTPHASPGLAESQPAERGGAGSPPFVFEAALRAEAKKLDTAMRFLREAAARARPPAEVRVFDPVPHLITRRAGLERAQLLVQSSSRPALQHFLATLSRRLFDHTSRAVHWHLDVDPIEFD